MGWDRPRDQGSGAADRPPPPEQDKPPPPEPTDRPEPVRTERLPEKEEPSGERIVETATDEQSMERRLRRVLFERGDDITDNHEWLEGAKEIFGDRPTGHPGTVKPDYPTASVPKYGVESDHVAGLALLAAVTVIKIYELAANKVRAWKERGDAGE